MCILHAQLASVLKFKVHHALVNRTIGFIVLSEMLHSWAVFGMQLHSCIILSQTPMITICIKIFTKFIDDAFL